MLGPVLDVVAGFDDTDGIVLMYNDGSILTDGLMLGVLLGEMETEAEGVAVGTTLSVTCLS